MPGNNDFNKENGLPGQKDPHLPPDLLMDAPIGFFTSSSEGGRLFSANMALARMLGYDSPDELIDSITDISMQMYAEAEDRKQIRAILDTQGSVSDFKCRWIDRASNELWVAIHAKAIKDTSGSTAFYQGFITDITQHVKSEQELFEKEIEQHYLIEGLPIPSFVIGRDHMIVHWNRAMEEFSGIRAESVIDTNLHWKAFYDQQRPCLADLLIENTLDDIQHWYGSPISRSNMIDGAYELTAFFPALGENGKWLQCTVAAIYDSSNYMIGAIETIIDVTGQKMMEGELREKEERYRLLFENSPLGVLHSDEKGVIVSCNDNFVKIIGSSYDKLIGLNMLDLPDKKLTGELEKALKGGTGFYEDVYHSLTADKATPVKVNFQPIIGDNGQILGCVGVIEDITNRRKLEDRLRQSQKMDSVGRLAGGVAHDFNNMLNVILGYTELAMSETDPSGPLYKNLKEILNAAHRSAGITRQLLAFARKQAISPRALDLNEKVGGMLKMLGRLIGENMDLAWLPGPGLWQVKMDPSQIDQILANLCVNARDAISGVGRISIETRKVSLDQDYCSNRPNLAPGDFVMLSVSDNGCGIDKKTLEDLFEPFFTTKDVDKGTGLGLATVYGIVRQNNGFIDVYSEPGQGTTFKIYLPAHKTGPEKSRKTEPARPPAASGSGSGSGRGSGSGTILLVEDEEQILEMTRLMLGRLGYTVLAASTPNKAVAIAAENASQIDLLLTDVIMPEMNGRTLADNLKALCPNIKCLFMSGYTADVIASHGVLDKEVKFIQKPFTMQDLTLILREVLE